MNMSPVSRIRLGALLCVIAVLSVGDLTGQTHVPLVLMPSRALAVDLPSEDQIEEFAKRYESSLDMTAQELAGDLPTASAVLGQHNVFSYLSDFRERTQIDVKVRFVTWPDALRYLTDYVSVPTNPPLVAQVGESWASHFRSLGVVRYEKRFYRDVKVLWYWRDLVRPEELLDDKSFLEACRRLTESGPTELKTPLAIATGTNFNLLHDLAVFLYSAGVETLISTDKRLGIFPWKEARFVDEAGERAVRFLIELTRRGYLDLPDTLEVDVTREFMDRRYAMIIQGSGIVKAARKRWGDEWRSKLGATLPPRIGGPINTTMMGGSFLMVLDPDPIRTSDQLEPARRLVDYFSSNHVEASVSVFDHV